MLPLEKESVDNKTCIVLFCFLEAWAIKFKFVKEEK